MPILTIFLHVIGYVVFILGLLMMLVKLRTMEYTYNWEKVTTPSLMKRSQIRQRFGAVWKHYLVIMAAVTLIQFI